MAIVMYMKRNVHISIEDYLHEQAKARGINISAVCEDELRKRLENFNKQIIPEECNHEFTWPFSTPGGLVKECKLCGLFKRINVESFEETKKE